MLDGGALIYRGESHAGKPLYSVETCQLGLDMEGLIFREVIASDMKLL